MSGKINSKIAAFNCPNCGAAVSPDEVRCPYCRSTLTTLICASCFAAVSIGSKHCPSCGMLVETSDQKPATALKCPGCATPLCAVPVGKNRIHECTECGGLWVGKDAFQDICTRQEDQETILNFQPNSDLKDPRKAPARRRAYVPCPECGKLMNRENFLGCSGVVLDWCRNHGSWFDRMELQQIVAFIRNGGLRKSRDRELARLEEEKQKLRMQEMELAMRSAREGSSFRSDLRMDCEAHTFAKLLSSMLPK